MQIKNPPPSPNFKYPVILNDGYVVEAVYYDSGTLCLSSQAGCALACPFCASGRQGLKRQLTTAELQLQLQMLRLTGREPRRLTISGIGEPLHNWGNLRDFIVESQRQGLKVSVTTTGAALDHLHELIEVAANGVMISLHAASPEIHQKLIPKGPDFHRLCTTISQIHPLISRRKRRKIGINYLLFSGINDKETDLLALTELLESWQDFTLHLLSYNPIDGADFHSYPEKLDEWHDRLQQKGLSVRRPNPWRNDADGGCGTLFLSSLSKENNGG